MYEIVWVKDTELKIGCIIGDKRGWLDCEIIKEIEFKTTPNELIFWANTLGSDSDKSQL